MRRKRRDRQSAAARRRLRLALAALLFAVALSAAAGCGRSSTERARPIQAEEAMPQQTIDSVLARHSEELMALPGVAGAAIGECDGRPCIKVLVERRSPELETKLPASLEGYPVSVVESGPIRPMETP